MPLPVMHLKQDRESAVETFTNTAKNELMGWHFLITDHSYSAKRRKAHGN